jgi:hypothetical protein
MFETSDRERRAAAASIAQPIAGRTADAEEATRI